MTKAQIRMVAKAIYESHKFKKGWSHPDTVRLWHSVCESEARAAIIAYKASLVVERTKVAA